MSSPWAVRLLDGILVAFAAVLAAVLVTGGWDVPLGVTRLPVTRGEDVFLVMLVFAALRVCLRPVAFVPSAPGVVVTAAIAGYAVTFTFIAVTRHVNFRTHAMDLGYYVQVVWSIANGYGPYETLLDQHAWAGHLSPILYLLAPLGWLAPGGTALVVTQAVALALGAAPVYLLARSRTGPHAAATLAVLYLVNPSLHGITLRDFHPAALAIPLLLTAMHVAETGRWPLFLAATVLTLATREDAAIPVVGLGIWLAAARGRWVLGGSIAVLSAVWLFVAVHWVVPFFRGEAYPYFGARYGHLGGSLGEIVLSPLLRPTDVLGLVSTPRRLIYLAALLAPLGFLPLGAPIEAIGAVPALAQNLLNIDPVLFHYRTQYQSFVLPFLMVGAIHGFARLQARVPALWLTPRMALAAGMVASLALGARTINDVAVPRWWPDERQQIARRLLDTIPPAAAVSVNERFFAHLALRREVFVYPYGLDRSEYVVVTDGDLASRHRARPDAPRRGETVDLPRDRPGRPGRFVIVEARNGIVVLRKAGE